MSLNENKKNEHVTRFLELLEICYEGELKTFSDDFSNGDDTFYEKLKKEIQRARAGTVTLKKEDNFKKYNFFLEYKLWEKNNTDTEMKIFDLKVTRLIRNL
ncbi:hypothetical protein [Acinetobacter sp. ANC 4862]|uniref:hypothetical protein n=1 Tax=Acinetobacter sp. ANC 4862 TaxID=2529849 RepID=UPI00103B90F7|nr:hypothetical protein [Acinetobacter sp. ANC 4862]TCH63253.1 hypothetical protein E0409_10710 [Acinetobacter sp. ANC 4862]